MTRTTTNYNLPPQRHLSVHNLRLHRVRPAEMPAPAIGVGSLNTHLKRDCASKITPGEVTASSTLCKTAYASREEITQFVTSGIKLTENSAKEAPTTDASSCPPTENERGAAKTFEEFVTRTKTSEWGTELTIMALAKTLNIKITTLMAAIRMTNSFGDGETEVSVGHINDESHYVALLPNPT